MKRLIVFSLIMIGLISILSLKNYKSYAISNERFDIKKAIESHEAHKKELTELEARQHPVKKVEGSKPEAPLVLLDTPQLIRGSKLYGKCIVCHGKKGEGKKSQSAPRIGGQLSSYVEEQVLAMKSKMRINKKMFPYVKKLTAEEVKDLSVYISKMPWVN